MDIRLIIGRLIGLVYFPLIILIPIFKKFETNDLIYYCVFLTLGVFLVGIFVKGSQTNILY